MFFFFYLIVFDSRGQWREATKRVKKTRVLSPARSRGFGPHRPRVVCRKAATACPFENLGDLARWTAMVTWMQADSVIVHFSFLDTYDGYVHITGCFFLIAPRWLCPKTPIPIILTWHGLNFDQYGSRSRVRPFHCTSVRLTSAITTNVGDSSA